ncbi:DNA adenine methylase [bacterium]|jgi:DNA adenine methylase|nr:DNA adenine methylase [bacterium]
MAKPFLKWAGGKRQLSEALCHFKPATFSNYFEPFLGGGAFFFQLLPETAYLSDINHDLITTYTVVKNNVSELIQELSSFSYSEETYYKIRNQDRLSSYSQFTDLQKAARFIYLNKTCYNGLYRVNLDNQINTPFGHYKNPLICDQKNLIAVSKKLQHVQLDIQPFQSTLKHVQKNDFIYLDPPYDPVSKTSNFTGYAKDKFGKDEQIALKNYCDAIDKKNAFFMVSNSSTDFIKDIYKDYTINTIKANRSINSNAKKRGPVDEVLITNYPTKSYTPK